LNNIRRGILCVRLAFDSIQFRFFTIICYFCLFCSQTTTIDPCAFCYKPEPIKKCSKSHSRCKGKLFCDKICETQSHKKVVEQPTTEEGAVNENDTENDLLEKQMSEAAKAEKAKKKKARKNGKAGTKNDGEFWWNNSVYASW
jgi:hypothetical protein